MTVILILFAFLLVLFITAAVYACVIVSDETKKEDSVNDT